MKKAVPALIAFALSLSLAFSVEGEFNAQFYTLYAHNFKQNELDLVLTALPDFTWSQDLKHNLQLEAEYSLRGRVTNAWHETTSHSLEMEHYRAWLRFGLPQSDLRIGLQQLNFGSAQILRPLKWFDKLNPLDKSLETEGVWAALVTHNWLNNSNLWLWGIVADSETKGNEGIASQKGSPEFGGRVQIPNILGESALAVHRRSLPNGHETRLGLDHRYDGAIGLWVEASGSRFDLAASSLPRHQLSATLGADYTIGIGSGVAVTLETMVANSSAADLDKLHNDSVITALMVSYPLGLLDNLTLLGVHSYTADTTNLAFLWRRTYDYLSWDLSASLDSGYASALSHNPTITLKISYDL